MGSLHAVAEDNVFEASAIAESQQYAVAAESAIEDPAVALGAAGLFDPSILLVVSVGIIGLIWMRRHIQAS